MDTTDGAPLQRTESQDIALFLMNLLIDQRRTAAFNTHRGLHTIPPSACTLPHPSKMASALLFLDPHASRGFIRHFRRLLRLEHRIFLSQSLIFSPQLLDLTPQ